LGEAVVRRLAAEGCSLKLLLHRRVPERLPTGARVIKGSLGSVTLESEGAVFHCGRLRGNGKWGRYLAAWRGNFANRKIIRQLGNTPLVYASGSLMYGDCGTSPVMEDAPLRPTGYAREYVIAERPFLKAPVMMFRPGWILGPGSWFEWFYLGPAEQSGAVPLYGSGENLMSLIHLDDCAAAMIHVARANRPGIYHPPSLAVMTQREFAEVVACELGLPTREVSAIGKERAMWEAFRASINLQSKHTELWSSFVPKFRDIRTAMRDVLAARKARTRQNATPA
jgi:nucleoside-diphosphate-sugar epimerase